MQYGIEDFPFSEVAACVSAFRAFAQRNSISSKTLRSFTYLYLTLTLSLSLSPSRSFALSPTKVISLPTLSSMRRNTSFSGISIHRQKPPPSRLSNRFPNQIKIGFVYDQFRGKRRNSNTLSTLETAIISLVKLDFSMIPLGKLLFPR